MPRIARSANANEEMNDLSEIHSGEYLTFVLGTEEYPIDILKIQEIRGYEPPTQIANIGLDKATTQLLFVIH